MKGSALTFGDRAFQRRRAMVILETEMKLESAASHLAFAAVAPTAVFPRTAMARWLDAGHTVFAVVRSVQRTEAPGVLVQLALANTSVNEAVIEAIQGRAGTEIQVIRGPSEDPTPPAEPAVAPHPHEALPRRLAGRFAEDGHRQASRDTWDEVWVWLRGEHVGGAAGYVRLAVRYADRQWKRPKTLEVIVRVADVVGPTKPPVRTRRKRR